VAKQALVPLNIAEFLRVTLQIAKQSESLSSDQKARIGMVLALYEVGRDEHLLNNGWTQQQIDGAAKSAALALANRFDDAQNQTLEEGDLLELPKDDFDMDDFERQFDGDHHPNPD
jgi:hypothetical protein